VGSATDRVGLSRHQRVDERGQQLAQQIRACLGQLFLNQAGRVNTGRDGPRSRSPSARSRWLTPRSPLAFGLQALLLVLKPLLLLAQRSVLVLEVGDALLQRRPARKIRTAPEPTATVDTRPGGYNQPIHRQGPLSQYPPDSLGSLQ
jgi:hypothetical protein